MQRMLLAVAFAIFAPAAAFAAEPPIVFQVQPAGQLIEKVRSIARMAGGDAAIKELNAAIKEKLGDKGFEGLDLERPVLGYVLMDGKLEEVVGVVVVPITGEKEFLALFERFSDKKLTADDTGYYEIPTPGPDAKVGMRFSDQHAYFAIGKDPKPALAAKKLVPAARIYDPSDKATAVARLRFDRLPKQIREELADGLKELKNKLDDLHLPMDAGETARQAVDELIKLGRRYTDLLQDAETATVRWIVDTETSEAAIELGLTGRPGTRLAEAIASRKPSTNKFAGLVTPDSMVGIKLQLPLFAEELQNAAVIGLEAGQKLAGENVPPPFKGAVDETFKGLIRTVKQGEFDLAVSFRGPDKNGLYTVVGAVAFEDPSGLEKELRELVKKQLPPELRENVKLDAAQVGQVNIHQIKFGGLLPAEVQKMFGEDASVAIAFAPHGIFVAFGPDAIGTMKAALLVKKAPSPVLELSVNPSRLRKIVEALGKEVPEGLGTTDALIPSWALSIEGGKELRLKLSTNLKGFEGVGGLGLPFGAAKGSARPPKAAKQAAPKPLHN